ANLKTPSGKMHGTFNLGVLEGGSGHPPDPGSNRRREVRDAQALSLEPAQLSAGQPRSHPVRRSREHHRGPRLRPLVVGPSPPRASRPAARGHARANPARPLRGRPADRGIPHGGRYGDAAVDGSLHPRAACAAPSRARGAPRPGPRSLGRAVEARGHRPPARPLAARGVAREVLPPRSAPPPPGLGAHRGSDGRGPRDLARGMSLSGSRAVRRALAANLLLALLTAPARAASGPDRPRPHVLTLALALQEGLASDPQPAARAEIVRQAEADVRTASLPPNPSLSVSGTLIPFGGSFTAATQGGPPQLDVGLSYPLDWVVFGKRGAAVASATAGLDQ